ncbi:MAG: hypothetical protein JWQ02_3228, partial [Capsulimonas sp.]|nr:hypothetical protein [Capsulimonas sp.]
MVIAKSDEYEEMAAAFQCLEIARLNETLKEHGINDKSLRQAICKSYFFESGGFLDSGWFKSSGKTLFPEVCFAERSVDPERGLGEIQTLNVPSDYFSYHEYAGGDIHWYFDEHEEDAGDIE